MLSYWLKGVSPFQGILKGPDVLDISTLDSGQSSVFETVLSEC